MIHVLIAERMYLIRMGLVSCLRHEPDIDVVAELEAGDQLVKTAARLRPAVVIMGVDLPPAGGPATAEQVRTELPECAIMLLVDHENRDDLRDALTAQPLGLLLKATTPDTLSQSIRRLVAGKTVMDPRLAPAARSIADNPLTPREREALRMAAEGATTAEIATRLSVSIKTVQNHLSSVMSRLDARNRVDAIRIATERNWL